MELLAASPKTRIDFEASFTQSLLTVALLLRAAGRFEGLSEWIVRTAAALPDSLAADLRILALVTAICPGLWSEFIRAGRTLGPADFECLISELERQPADALRDAARRGLDRRLVEWAIAEPGAACTADHDHLVTLVERVWAERRERGEGAGDETVADSDRLARLLSASDLLQRHVAVTFRALWEVYRHRCWDDWVQMEQAVIYHQRQHYPHEFSAAFSAITGRTVPERLRDQLDKVTRVVMTPVSHIGPYLLLSEYDDGIFVAFNADTAPVRVGPDGNVAALYPPLKALADETRLQIVSLLVGGERYVGEIAELLDLSQSSASRHLNLLTAAEILAVRRENNLKYFRINPERARALLADLQHLLHL